MKVLPIETRLIVDKLVNTPHFIAVRLSNKIYGVPRIVSEMSYHMSILAGKILMNK